MLQSEIEKKHRAICQSIYQGKFKSALDMLARLLKYTTQAEYFYQIESISDNYQNLLKYAFEGYQDTKRTEILDSIAASILTLADEIRQNVIDKEFPQRRVEKALLSRELGDDSSVVIAKIEGFLSGREPDHEVKVTGVEFTTGKTYENIFKFIWMTGKLKDDHKNLLRQLNRSSSIEWPVKCLVVSALTLSLLDYFDQEKILILTEFIDSQETNVYQRALIGLIIALLFYDQRISFYPEIVKKLKELSFNESLQKDTEVILLQLLMAKETEKITKEFEEEILPEMKKVMPKLEDKLQLGNLLEDNDMEGKNPDWKELIDEVPGLFERIEKFTRRQMEGGDLFMSTFSALKRFDFFNMMSNWFVPFYPSHPELKKMAGDEEEFSPRLLEGLEKAFYICNSDKYSFALNFQAVPQQQRSMIITYFESELEQMKEMVNEEQLLDQSLVSNAIMTQYIQDLYRFFKLYPHKNEFQDIFQLEISFNRLYFYRTFFEREGFTERLASFYFEKGHYFEAIEVYKYVVEKGGPKSEYFEKIGYSNQQLGRFKTAIEFYKKAELFDANRLWILKKLGWCCLKIKDFENALHYFEDAGRLQPDDLNIQAQIGHCQLKLTNFDEALQHYSKVRYFQPDNLKVLRPIAYCQFVLGKLDNAAEAYEEILAKSEAPAPYDLMNLGHVLFCLGRKKEALEYYKKSRSSKLFTTEMFMEAFDEDVSYLLKNGVKREEIPLLLDYLLFQIE